MKHGGITAPARRIWILGCAAGAIAVAGGAFGAHALEGRVPPSDLAILETANRYMMYHALAILASALAVGRGAGVLARSAGYAFVGGIIIFCGSLYMLVLVGPRAWGAVTPIGGLAFLLGWGLLAASLSHRTAASEDSA